LLWKYSNNQLKTIITTTSATFKEKGSKDNTMCTRKILVSKGMNGMKVRKTILENSIKRRRNE
jgi:hypothetical protein